MSSKADEIGELPSEVVEALKRFEGSRSLVRKLICIYTSDTPNLVIALQASTQSRDRDQAISLLHQLKSLAANFGPNETQQKAEELELRLIADLNAAIAAADMEELVSSSKALAAKLHDAFDGLPEAT